MALLLSYILRVPNACLHMEVQNLVGCVAMWYGK